MAQLSDLNVETGRIVRFGIVGVCATIVYAASSLIAIEVFQFSPVLASIIGQTMAMGISYFGHSIFSFRVASDHATFLWRFLIIAGLTFGMNGVVTWLLTDILGLRHRISIAIVTVLIPITNYVCNRFWVFLPGLRSPSEAGEA